MVTNKKFQVWACLKQQWSSLSITNQVDEFNLFKFEWINFNDLINSHLFKKPDSFLLLLSFGPVGEFDEADEFTDTSVDDRSVSSDLSLWMELFVVSATESIDWAFWRLLLFWLLYSADFWFNKYDSDKI